MCIVAPVRSRCEMADRKIQENKLGVSSFKNEGAEQFCLVPHLQRQEREKKKKEKLVTTYALLLVSPSRSTVSSVLISGGENGQSNTGENELWTPLFLNPY